MFLCTFHFVLPLFNPLIILKSSKENKNKNLVKRSLLKNKFRIVLNGRREMKITLIGVSYIYLFSVNE